MESFRPEETATGTTHQTGTQNEMAQSTVVTMTDDIDGTPATETVGFAYKGKGYELDLNEENVAKLEAALEPFLAAARRTRTPAGFGGQLRRGKGVPRPAGRSGGDAAIRDWGRRNGYAVSDRGRVSTLLRKAYGEAKQRGEVMTEA